MPTESLDPRSVTKLDGRSVAAAGLCLAAAFFDTLGWLMGVIGIVLLRRSAFSARIRWALATLALLPKVMFTAVRLLRAPRGLAFSIDDSTLATSPSLWGYCALLVGFGWLALLQKPSPAIGAPTVVAEPLPKSSVPLKCLGLLAMALGMGMLLGVLDGFHRIDDLGDGRWALTHAARGTLVTFTRGELSSIEATELNTRQGPNSRHIVVTLTGGRTYSETTRFFGAFQELRDFATTADLAPGTVRIRPYRGQPWTNGAGGFAPKDFIGQYEHADASTGERSTLEFLPRLDRLEGRETSYVGSKALERKVSNIRLSDTGKVEFDLGTIIDVGAPTEASRSISLRWSANRQSAQLTGTGLEMGPTRYTRR
ncbi:MAG TPA: hypothetical protein VIV60_27720 [Polyangiaceae bacterium]